MSDCLAEFRSAILASLGFAPDIIEPGKLQRFPTSTRTSDRAGWCRMFDDLRAGVFGCHRRDVSESWFAEDARRLPRAQRAEIARQVHAAKVERDREQRQQWEENRQRIRALWSECVPLVPGDPCTLYLKRRGFGGVWPLPSVLRLHRGLAYWDGAEMIGSFPAMVAPVVAPDGRTVALHRTYLTMDGRKADVPTVKKLTAAAGSLAGACIPLHRPSCEGVLGVAEGVETALAAWCASSVPTVAAYCAGNLAAWRWPPGLKRVVIFADGDAAGREAAAALRARARSAGLFVKTMIPDNEGEDWCDVWAERIGEVIETGGRA